MKSIYKETSFLKNTVSYVTQLFKEKLPSWAVYHNLSHTIETVNGCTEIGKGSGLPENDLEILCIAAWFHDTGYIFKIEEHEEKSSEIALKYLKENDYPIEKINKILECIMATKTSILPKNLLEFIICDSDLITLGKPDYFKRNELLKLEIELRENKSINEYAWLKRSLNFLSSHNFYTDYARLNYSQQLEKNLLMLRNKIKEHDIAE